MVPRSNIVTQLTTEQSVRNNMLWHEFLTTNSTYISILSVPMNDILETDSVLNILKTNSVLTNIEI